MPTILTEEQFRKKYGQAGVDKFKVKSKEPGYVSRVLTDIGEEAKSAVSSVQRGAEMIQEGKPVSGALRGSLGTAGAAARAVFSPLTEAVAPQIQKLVKGAEEAGENPILQRIATNPTVSKVLDKILGGVDKIQDWATQNPDTAAIVTDAIDIAASIGGGKIVKEGVSATTKTIKTTGKEMLKAGETITKGLGEAGEMVVSKIPKYAEKASNILSEEPSAQVKTILSRTSKKELEDAIQVAEKHSISREALSGFEVVGDKLAEAEKKLFEKMSFIGKAKSNIIAKAKTGLVEFKDAPRRAILEVMKLEDSPFVKEVISKLKTIKTKLDADKVIDDVQDMIYSAGRTNVIAEGSRVEKQLRGIIGKMNEELKSSLPEAYRSLNTKWADYKKMTRTLNRMLGETVEGVPIRGASLIKQFFSPSGRAAKEIFEFIKKNTKLDLAKEATLAKFAGELFDDATVRSLLQGIPTSTSGLVSGAAKFLYEKTGAGGKVRESIRKGTIQKAKELTK